MGINDIELCISQYRPCCGSSYIPLPDKLKGTRSLLNIKNTNDNLCFIYCILADLYPTDVDALNPNSYIDYIPTLKFYEISFPIHTRDISKFESLNSLRVNIFGYDSDLKTGKFTLVL